MNPDDITESDLLVDLENGQTSTQDNACGDIILNAKHQKDLPARIYGDRLDLDNLPGKKDGFSQSSSVLSTGETSDESIEIVLDKLMKDSGEKRSVKEKRKTTSKKPPRPPRPPTGPSLDAADVRFAREISEFSVLKRKRLEHLKEVKKSKADKTSSSTSSILAMFITVIFFLVLIFQGDPIHRINSSWLGLWHGVSHPLYRHATVERNLLRRPL